MSQQSLFPDNQFRDPTVLKEFILAGKAKITVRSERTLKHFTYKITRDKDSPIQYVKRLVAEGNYVFIGIIEDNAFRHTRKHEWHRHTEQFKGFQYLWKYVSRNIMPTDVTVFHEGRCGMCGLALTDPISIKEGYGPDCRKKRLNRDFKA